jgi:outer membrane protein TolC
MNKKIALLLSAATVWPCLGADFLSSYFPRKTEREQVRVQDVEGLSQHIADDGKLHLRLHDFLELMLKNSADIQITRMNVYNAANAITGAKAIFDPSLAPSFSTQRILSPPSPFYFTQGAFSNLTQQSAIAYNQLLPSGQTINSSFSVARISGAGYNSPELFGNLQFSVTQPLLRNRTGIENRAPLVLARSQLNITSEVSESVIGTAVANAAQQYWQAILARDGIHVQQQAVTLAQKANERDQKALELGALSKLDIYQSEAQVADSKRNLIQAQHQYTAALDGLRRLIGADLTPAMRSTDIVLEDDASVIPAKNEIPPFEEALSKALAARPEVQVADQQISMDEFNARVARQTFLPRLDLQASGGSSGPAANFGVAGIVYPGLSDTLRQVLGFNYPSYGLSLNMTLPFRNSTAQANFADALVNKTRDVYQKRQTREQIILDVRQAIDAIDLANATIDAAITARDFARKNVEAEQQKFELGTILVFELLDSQTKLAASETALLGAYVNYQEAYISYQRATWTLLNGLGMLVQKPSVR